MNENGLDGGEKYLYISVTDTGIGIEDSNKNKIFKLFESIKDQKKQINTQGIGLGLVISKLLVQKFNGEINFMSQHKKGATFYFSFEIEPISHSDLSEYKSK